MLKATTDEAGPKGNLDGLREEIKKSKEMADLEIETVRTVGEAIRSLFGSEIDRAKMGQPRESSSEDSRGGRS